MLPRRKSLPFATELLIEVLVQKIANLLGSSDEAEYLHILIMQVFSWCSPYTLLLARDTCSTFKDVIEVHQSIWRDSRDLLSLPSPPPEDDLFYSSWTEIRYANFLFRGGHCSVCVYRATSALKCLTPIISPLRSMLRPATLSFTAYPLLGILASRLAGAL